MISFAYIFSILVAYLFGSIPSAVWIGRYFYGIDVREYGSGNAGATNTFRVLGKKAGIPVLLLDILKGWLAMKIAYMSEFKPGSDAFLDLQMVLGIAALMGHIFPLFAGFRGGKGVATLLGIIVTVHPQAALLTLGVFLLVLILTRYVSLSSMTAAIAFPSFIIFVFDSPNPSLLIFSIFIASLVLITHQKNIERLLNREESKVKLFKKKKEEEEVTEEKVSDINI